MKKSLFFLLCFILAGCASPYNLTPPEKPQDKCDNCSSSESGEISPVFDD